MEIFSWLRSNGNKVLPIHHLFLRHSGDSCKWKSEGWRGFGQVVVFVHSRQRGLVSMGGTSIALCSLMVQHRCSPSWFPVAITVWITAMHSDLKIETYSQGEETNRKTKSLVKLQTPSPLAQIFFSHKVTSRLTPSHYFLTCYFTNRETQRGWGL